MAANNLEQEKWRSWLTKAKQGDFHLSASALKQFCLSPRHFKNYKSKEWEPSADMVKGTVLHHLLLKVPVEADYLIFDKDQRPDLSKTMAGKENKEWKLSLEEQGKPLISKEDYDHVEKMADAVIRNPIAGPIFKEYYSGEGLAEFEFLVDIQGIMFKGFIDLAMPFQVIDIKKTRDASPKGKIQWAIRDYGYALQMGIYWIATAKQKDMILLFIDEGLNISMAQLLPETLREQEYLINQAVKSFKGCMDFNLWNSSYEFWTENGYYYL